MKPEVKKFTRDNPCTKADIWNCFRRRGRFAPVPVPDAHAVIGVNVPRDMEAADRLVKISTAGTDYYKLTVAGEHWVRNGILRYIKNHPADIHKVRYLPPAYRPTT